MASKRKRRLSLPDRTVRPEAVPGRGTFAVARANRILAETLPGLVGVGSSLRARTEAVRGSRAVVREAAPAMVSRPYPGAKPEPRPQHDQRPLKLEGPLPDGTCKDRPAGGGGSGRSRPFVPWCKKR